MLNVYLQTALALLADRDYERSYNLLCLALGEANRCHYHRRGELMAVLNVVRGRR